MSGWRFKTAAHSSKMLTKRHRLYRLAGQFPQAREGFAVAPGPCPSGSPPLLMAAARAGLVKQRGSDMSGWRFKTASHEEVDASAAVHASTARWSSSVKRACVAVIIAVDDILRLDLDGDAILAIAEA